MEAKIDFYLQNVSNSFAVAFANPHANPSSVLCSSGFQAERGCRFKWFTTDISKSPPNPFSTLNIMMMMLCVVDT